MSKWLITKPLMRLHAMRRSLHETGFAVLYNHPISAERIDSIYQGWGDFFAGDTKFDFAVEPPRHDGYFAFRSENAKDSLRLKT